MTKRRRGSELEEAILEAGWAQLSEHGYAGFTFEAVANRAKTGKAAVYRRWPDRESLLVAVLAHWGLGTPRAVPDTGALSSDVIELLRAANRFGTHIAALFSTILGAYFNDMSTTPAELRNRLLGDRGHAMETILQRALERGELNQLPPARVATLPVDLLRHELLMNLQPVPDQTIIEIVETAFLPLVASAPPTSDRDWPRLAATDRD